MLDQTARTGLPDGRAYRPTQDHIGGMQRGRKYHDWARCLYAQLPVAGRAQERGGAIGVLKRGVALLRALGGIIWRFLRALVRRLRRAGERLGDVDLS